MKRSAQARLDDFVKSEVFDHLPNETQIDLKILIKNFIKRVVNLERQVHYYRHMAKKYRKRLIRFGLWKKKRRKRNGKKIKAKSRTTRHRRRQTLEKIVKYLDKTTEEMVEVTAKVAMNLIESNPHLNEKLNLKYSQVFIRNNRSLVKQLDDDHEYSSNIFWTGLLRGWTTRDYLAFNRVV